jgi:predicted nucleic acid binding AN1-type Zn finger protein
MLEQILKQLEKGIINWYGAKILIEDLYKDNVTLGDVSKCECGETKGLITICDDCSTQLCQAGM